MTTPPSQTAREIAEAAYGNRPRTIMQYPMWKEAVDKLSDSITVLANKAAVDGARRMQLAAQQANRDAFNKEGCLTEMNMAIRQLDAAAIGRGE